MNKVKLPVAEVTLELTDAQLQLFSEVAKGFSQDIDFCILECATERAKELQKFTRVPPDYQEPQTSTPQEPLDP